MTEARDARLDTLEACFDLALEAGAAASSRAFVALALGLASRRLGATRLSFIVPSETRGEWMFAGALGIREPVLREGAVTVRENVLHHVLQTRETVCCADMGSDRRFGANKKLRYKTQSFLVAPALVKDRVQCFLCATEKEDGSFGEADAGFARDLVRTFSPIYELLRRGERERETLLRTAELRRVRELQDRPAPRVHVALGLDLHVKHLRGPGQRIGAWQASAAANKAHRFWITDSPLESATAAMTAMTAVHGLPPAQALCAADFALGRLDAEAAAVMLTGEGTKLTLAGAAWPGLWHYVGRSKSLEHLVPAPGVLGKGANQSTRQHRVALRDDDCLVFLSPSAFKDTPVFRKRLLEAILKRRSEGAKAMAEGLDHELFPASESGTERILAVLRIAVKAPKKKAVAAKKPAKKKGAARKKAAKKTATAAKKQVKGGKKKASASKLEKKALKKKAPAAASGAASDKPLVPGA